MQSILKKSKYQGQYLNYLPKRLPQIFLFPSHFTLWNNIALKHTKKKKKKSKPFRIKKNTPSLQFFKSLDFKELSYNMPQITLKDKLKKQATRFISLSILDESSLERNERRTTEKTNKLVSGVSPRSGLRPFPCPTTDRALEEGYGRIIQIYLEIYEQRGIVTLSPQSLQ